ncbi:hypothetical protein KM043_006484 [Ampulex compressa]|nr:hypothetical protein KM043_006484 [Ampulex compressa]
MILVLVLLLGAIYGNGFNDFPSLITANATMAVIIDRNFFGNKNDYRHAVAIISDLINDIVRKEMHVGGIVAHVYRDVNVNLRRDYTILLSVALCHRSWQLHELARKAELVHIAITDTDCPRIPDTEGIGIPMIEPGEELPQIFLDLRMTDALSWNIINVLHDDTFDRDMIGRVMRAISNELPHKQFNLITRALFTLRHGETERSRKRYIRMVLEDFHVEQLGNCFLVIATVDMAADVIEIANSLKMVHPGSQWLYVITDSASQNATDVTFFVDLLVEGGNVAFMYNATNVRGICNAGLACYIGKAIKAVAKAFEHSLLTEIELYGRVNSEEFDIIRLTKSERRREILKNSKVNLFHDMSPLNGLCGKCLFWRFFSAITWGNVFHRDKSASYLSDTGSWKPGLGINLTDVIFPHVAHGFRGITVPIATYHNPPWQIIKRINSREISYDGLIFDVVKHLGKKLNFTYTVITPSADWQPGYSNQSAVSEEVILGMSATRKLPSEIINLVRAKKVLMGACAYTISESGKSTINFTIPIFVQSYSFLTSRPKQLSRALLFASPFTKETWACLAASIITMGPILYLIHKYSPYSTETSGLNSSWQCVWYVYGALLQQGGMYLPKSDSARILVGIWWLVVMVLVATYSGSLVAFLTFPRMDASILTIEDLLTRKDKLTWSFPNSSVLEAYLDNADEEKYKLLLKHSTQHNETEEMEAVKRVKEGKHVLIDWRSSLRFLMRRDLLLTGECHFSLSADEFMNEPIAMIMSQESPYLSVVDSELHRMHESGLMHKWFSEKMPMKDKCWEVPGNNQAVNKRKVNVADMQGIFFVLFMGITGAILLLCCELYWHRRKKARERRLIRPFVS